MRPALKEYPLDLLFARTFQVAQKLGRSTEKERAILLQSVPYVSGLLGPILSIGQPAITFLELMADYYGNLINAKKEGKKVVMTTFCFDPTIFYAFGNLVPVTLEVGTVITSILWKRGSFDFMDFCTEVGFSETGCSSQRGTMGAYLSGAGVEIDLVAVNMGGVCDTNSNAYSFAAQYLNKPFYGLDYPSELTPDEVTDYHHKDYRALIRFLEEHGQCRFDIDRLRELLEEKKIQDELTNELEEMQRLVPNPLPGIFHLLIYAARYTNSGSKKFTRMLREMVEVVRDNATNGRSGMGQTEKCRALLFYIDNFSFNVGMFDWLARHQVSHMGSMLSRFFPDNAPYRRDVSGTCFSIDTRSLDTMIDTLADINARMPMTRTIRGPYDAPNMWLEDSLSLAKIYKADCCVYNGTPGCRNTWSNVKLIARDLEKHGYPTHLVYADAFDGRVESWEATAMRMEEFFKIRGLL
ncbi:MAG: 2-hydroxyacyl-CoA dehydratase family protein [Desulfobacteraceae bacterium]|nr:2-hydroxyacyl-CoA dehydratase family protein [Desulfobacteraceae bacterium]